MAGTIQFNPAKGQLDGLTQHLKLEGKLRILLSGTLTEAELSQTQQTAVMGTDTDPPPPK